MIITMDMSSFDIDKIDQESEYDDEISRSGWNPAVDMLELEQLEHDAPDDSDTDSFSLTQHSEHDDVVDAVSAIFQRKTYSYRH